MKLRDLIEATEGWFEMRGDVQEITIRVQKITPSLKELIKNEGYVIVKKENKSIDQGYPFGKFKFFEIQLRKE